MVTETGQQAAEAAAQVRARLGARPLPTVAIIAGSGLGALADQVADAVRFPTSELAHWPRSTVEGHAGRLVVGRVAGLPTAVLQGRIHFYEGYPIQQVVFPIRVLRELGVQRLIVTNAAGGLERGWQAGELMLIQDHINLPGIAGQNPLIGPNDASVGPRFPAMENAYSPHLRALARAVAAEQGITLREGVYAMVSGPSYETPAELRLLHRLGAHAVGMSTAPEVVAARHAGMAVLGFSLLTNMVHFEPSESDQTQHDEVLAVGAGAAPRLLRLVEGLLARLAAAD